MSERRAKSAASTAPQYGVSGRAAMMAKMATMAAGQDGAITPVSVPIKNPATLKKQKGKEKNAQQHTATKYSRSCHLFKSAIRFLQTMSTTSSESD